MSRRALLLLLLFAVAVHARTHPQLTPQAAALKGFFLVPGDNLAVPLDGKARPVPFLTPAPDTLELVSGSDDLFVIDGDLYRRKAASMSLIARGVGALGAASRDDAIIATIVEKRELTLTGLDGKIRKVAYRRPGNWEMDRPFVAPDGGWVLAVVRDYTAPLDVYAFVLVNPKTLEYDEVELSRNFVPGALRQPISPTQVALQMMAQENDDNGFQRLVPSDIVVLDRKTKKLGPPPANLLPGRPSPDGKRSLLPGKMFYSDDKSCGGDETMVYDAPGNGARFRAGDGQVVSVLDFLPDNSGLIADVLTLKDCKNKGVIIPFGKKVTEKAWKPFPLPTHPGHLVGRVYP